MCVIEREKIVEQKISLIFLEKLKKKPPCSFQKCVSLSRACLLNSLLETASFFFDIELTKPMRATRLALNEFENHA